MAYSIVLLERVEQDVEEAFNYYEAVSLQLGIKFEEDLQDAFKRIAHSPHNYFNLSKGYRRIVLTHFPYMIVYAINEGARTVDVWGVFHQKSNPFFIGRRLGRK